MDCNVPSVGLFPPTWWKRPKYLFGSMHCLPTLDYVNMYVLISPNHVLKGYSLLQIQLLDYCFDLSIFIDSAHIRTHEFVLLATICNDLWRFVDPRTYIEDCKASR